MKSNLWRMKGRQCVYFGGLLILSVVFLCIHLLDKVGRLEEARERLERTVAKLKYNDEGIGHPRHLSAAAYDSQVELNGHSDDDLILIYNRVPKTGSTSFAGIAYDLCKRNKFHVLHVNTTKNAHVMSLSDQMRFIKNITEWQNKKPALYHGHLAYIEFTRFGIAKKPVYINVIRNPLDRLISYFYFVRYGDDFRPFLKRRKAGNKETFDECVEKGSNECDPEHLWLQIPFFCGQDAECWKPGSQWALERAKYNLLHNYLVVGITEELGDFVAVLEATIPRLFKGAVQLYNQGKKSHLRKTSHKLPPKEETLAIIQASHIWKMEQDFYDFVKEQFHFIKEHTFELVNGAYVEKGNRFHYEKIRPNR